MRVPVALLGAVAAIATSGQGTAQAATSVIGSNLAAGATQAEAHTTDTAFWPLVLASGGRVVAPADGQVLGIRVKGTALPSSADGAPPPDTTVHFQTLAPQPDGSVKVILTSGAFRMPTGGDPNQVSTFVPDSLCIKKGEFVAFNSVGGYEPTYYPRGTPYQVLGAVEGSNTAWFEEIGGTDNGDVFTGHPMAGQELLMQYTLGTGPDAAGQCGGGTTGGGTDGGGTSSPVKMKVVFQRVYVTSTRIIKPGIHCPAKATRCTGTATVRLDGRTRAKAPFAIAGGKSAHVTMRLSRTAYRALIRAPGRQLRVSLRLVSQLGTASGAVILHR